MSPDPSGPQWASEADYVYGSGALDLIARKDAERALEGPPPAPSRPERHPIAVTIFAVLAIAWLVSAAVSWGGTSANTVKLVLAGISGVIALVLWLRPRL